MILFVIKFVMFGLIIVLPILYVWDMIKDRVKGRKDVQLAMIELQAEYNERESARAAGDAGFEGAETETEAPAEGDEV